MAPSDDSPKQPSKFEQGQPGDTNRSSEPESGPQDQDQPAGEQVTQGTKTDEKDRSSEPESGPQDQDQPASAQGPKTDKKDRSSEPESSPEDQDQPAGEQVTQGTKTDKKDRSSELESGPQDQDQPAGAQGPKTDEKDRSSEPESGPEDQDQPSGAQGTKTDEKDRASEPESGPEDQDQPARAQGPKTDEKDHASEPESGPQDQEQPAGTQGTKTDEKDRASEPESGSEPQDQRAGEQVTQGTKPDEKYRSSEPESGPEDQDQPAGAQGTKTNSPTSNNPINGNGGAELEPSLALDPRDANTPDNWVRRNPSMLRLTGPHPFNAEAPLPDLTRHGFITPVPLHYVRNHGPVPKASWDDWELEITGLVAKPASLTMPQLQEAFGYREFPVSLVCSGNRRMEQNMVKPTVGFHWGAAAISTSVWGGAPLHKILDNCGIKSKEEGALHVCFEGDDESKYGTSLRREIAMDPARDIIVAYKHDGESLTPDHGFPVRLIIPGFIGGRMVKWLKRITVTSAESQNHYHFKDNRVFPSHVDAQLANDQNWWKKPEEYMINELNINSVITTPCHEEILPINTESYTLKGYAYSGGGKKVIRVEVTMDGGETWQVCSLKYHPEEPNEFGKYWCWCLWSLDVEEMHHLFDAKEIAVRAWDETHNTQPEKLIWNLMGMMNNCWFRVKKRFETTDTKEIRIIFEHPTQTGNPLSGWMTKDRLKKPSNEARNLKTFPASEVEKHNSSESCWIIVHDHVYDCTEYIKADKHPGGSQTILDIAGTDCTEAFDFHTDDTKEMLKGFLIGKLTTNEITYPVSCKLQDKINLFHDVRKLKFALPGDNQVLQCPVGNFIFVSATVGNKLRTSPYAPVIDKNAPGSFELVVKVREDDPLSQHLYSLEIGSFIDIKFPFGHIEYKGKGDFFVEGKKKFAGKLAMIAGGAGITRIYQVMDAILGDPEDRTEMFVVYVDETDDGYMLKEELNKWEKDYPGRVKVRYVAAEDWNVTEEILRENIPAAEEKPLALVCGPPEMVKAVEANLKKIKYDTENILVFLRN